MFVDLGEREREQIKGIINRLLSNNFLLKELDREFYIIGRRYREQLEQFFKFLGWEVVFDERHEQIFVTSSETSHFRNLNREESIWMLVLRLIYQEKRQELSLTEFPVVTLHEIRSKYETFRLPVFNKTHLQNLIQLGGRYHLIEPLDEDVRSNECRFRLFHSLMYAIPIDSIEKLHKRLLNYEIKTEDVPKDENT